MHIIPIYDPGQIISDPSHIYIHLDPSVHRPTLPLPATINLIQSIVCILDLPNEILGSCASRRVLLPNEPKIFERPAACARALSGPPFPLSWPRENTSLVNRCLSRCFSWTVQPGTTRSIYPFRRRCEHYLSSKLSTIRAAGSGVGPWAIGIQGPNKYKLASFFLLFISIYMPQKLQGPWGRALLDIWLPQGIGTLARTVYRIHMVMYDTVSGHGSMTLLMSRKNAVLIVSLICRLAVSCSSSPH